jgi:hypothetical protein
MRNPVVKYALIRLAIFAGILAVFLIIGFDPYFSTIIAASLALAISLLFLDKQRNAASSSLYKRVHGDDRDNDSKVEDEALDK